MKVDRRCARITAGASLRVIAAAALLVAAATQADLDPSDAPSWSLPGADLYDVEMRGDHAWAVGYWGTILLSTDGGRSWSPQATPTDQDLYAVSFSDPSHGWAVGAGGVVLRSVDGGRSWRRIPIATPDDLGGSRPWEAPLFDVAAVSASEAWVVGDFGAVLHTEDGESWERIAIPASSFADDEIPDRILNAVVFTDPERGWIAGEFGTTLHTEDGGRTWSGAHDLDGAARDVYLMSLAAEPGGLALATGVGGVVLRSSDGGASWGASDLPTAVGVYGAALRGRRALVVGDRGVIYASRDGGASWLEPTRPGIFRWLRAVSFGADGTVLAVGEAGLILRSTDAGESWQRTAGPAPPQASSSSEGPEDPR